MLAIVERLAKEESSSTRLALSTEAYGLRHVVLRNATERRGARIDPMNEAIAWELDPKSWEAVRTLAREVEPGSNSFRWLDDKGEVAVLLSPSGRT